MSLARPSSNETKARERNRAWQDENSAEMKWEDVKKKLEKKTESLKKTELVGINIAVDYT